MKEAVYTSLICKQFCSYYKSGKEAIHCGGYSYLKKFLTPSELNELIKILRCYDNLVLNEKLSFLCAKCDFREDGCDFAENKTEIPCGGYLIISRILNYLNL